MSSYLICVCGRICRVKTATLSQPTRSAFSLAASNRKQVTTFLQSFDNVLTDCDGVLWIGNQPLPGAADALMRFRNMGKRIYYVTNNSTKTRDEFVTKFQSIGFQADKEEIVSTAYLTASYMKEIGFKKNIYIVGSTGITQELDSVGISHTSVGPDVLSTSLEAFLKKDVKKEDNVGAVIVGFDEHFSYLKIMKAITYLSDPQCLFIATNPDAALPKSNNWNLPGAGGMVSSIQFSSGRKPVMIGKPSTYLCDLLMKKQNLNPCRTLMIGDRGDTDILLGSNCGFHTLLVLSGVTSLKDLEQWKTSGNAEERKYVPEYYINHLGDLLKLME